MSMTKAVERYVANHPQANLATAYEAVSSAMPIGSKNSFSVCFYTVRKKLGLTAGRKPRREISRRSVTRSGRAVTTTVSVQNMNLDTISKAANFIRELGGFEAAVAAVNAVNSLQFSVG